MRLSFSNIMEYVVESRYQSRKEEIWNEMGNVEYKIYKHDTHITSLCANASYIKGEVYEIFSKGRKIYTGQVIMNQQANTVSPSTRSDVSLLTNLGTSISQDQSASVLANVYKRAYLPKNQKLVIDGLGSSISLNPMNWRQTLQNITAQTMAVGIYEKIQQGINFIHRAPGQLVFMTGFSRGGIQAVGQINLTKAQKKFYCCLLDPVAGGGFFLPQAINQRLGYENLDKATEKLDEKNIIGGMIAYSKEASALFDPKVYLGKNYRSFLTHANHQNIDGVKASRTTIPGWSRLQEEDQMEIGHVVRSLLEKQLIMHGVGIFYPTYLSREQEIRALQRDAKGKSAIVNTPVILGGEVAGHYFNNRPQLIKPLESLQNLMQG